jgi:beta-lactam-binding protein with PASTA domain
MVEDPAGSLKTIPPVYEMSIAEASVVLEEAGFKPVASRRRFGEADATAFVRGTFPPEGGAAPIGSRVDLLPAVVRKAADEATGPTPVEQAIAQGIMPDLRGFAWEDAVRIMEGAGFRAWPRNTVALDVDPELVITTEPRPNTALATDLVVIWVSEGPGPPPEPFVPPPDKPIDVPIPPDFLEPKPES